MNVLISHTRSEAGLAGAWKDLLTTIFDGAIHVWYSSDLDEGGGVRAGVDWREQLNTRIAESQAILAIQTPDSSGRPWIMWECGRASGVKEERQLIPVVYGMGKDDIVSPLSSYQACSGEERREVGRICEALADLAGLPFTNDRFDAAVAAYEGAVKAALPASPSVSARDVARERERVQSFCRRVAGWWWERIEDDGIGFFELQMDDLHNSVRIQNGHFYDESGAWNAEYGSGIARIAPDKPSIVYMRECRKPERDAETYFHGYGDMSFSGSSDSFSSGKGLFFDAGVEHRRTTVRKSVILGRVVERTDIETLRRGDDREREALALRMLRGLPSRTRG